MPNGSLGGGRTSDRCCASSRPLKINTNVRNRFFASQETDTNILPVPRYCISVLRLPDSLTRPSQSFGMIPIKTSALVGHTT